MKNSASGKTKFSKVEKQTNMQIVFIFTTQIVLCLFAAIYSTIWTEMSWDKTDSYLKMSAGSDIFELNWYLRIIQRLGTWILIFTNFVPISLMVTLEVVKFLQASFITWDYRIYDESKDMPTKVQSSNLNEELGQVEYVFSDKTGTLTCNIMDFKKLCCGNVSYGTSKRKLFAYH
jgi:phospholipid-transporting ATPase